MSKLKGPTQMSFDITYKCNFRCLHCFNDSGEVGQGELTDVEVEKIIKEIIEIRPMSFCFCGGEPLLRASLVLEMAKMLYEAGIPTSLVSNGYILDYEMAKKLKEAGIQRVQISLDGKEESHNQLRKNKKSFSKAISALSHLQKVKLDSGIAFSPTSWNIKDFDEVYKIATQYNVKELRLQRMMPLGRSSLNEYILPDESKYRELCRNIYQKQLLYVQGKNDVSVTWGDPVEHLFLADKELANFIGITATGDLFASPYVPITLGNIRKDSIMSYWESGLEEIWKDKNFKNEAQKIVSVDNMNLNNTSTSVLTSEEHYQYDLMEEYQQKSQKIG